MSSGGTAWDCRGLLGADESALVERFGAPATRRDLGTGVWLVFERPGRSLRARLSNAAGAAAPPRLTSWTVRCAEGFHTLAGIAAAVGLWPDAAPDAAASQGERPLVRRALPGPAGPASHSLTASIRAGRFVQIAVFDEPPDWL